MNRAMRISVAVGLAAALTGVAATLTAEQSAQVVQIRDDCDPATFNADPPVGPGLGPDTCVRNGETTFANFVAQLQANGVKANASADGWEFKPGDMRLEVGEVLTTRNQGGEFHTFTE